MSLPTSAKLPQIATAEAANSRCRCRCRKARQLALAVLWRRGIHNCLQVVIACADDDGACRAADWLPPADKHICAAAHVGERLPDAAPAHDDEGLLRSGGGGGEIAVD